MCIFAPEIDASHVEQLRKAFVRSELLIRQIYPEDTSTMPFAFRVCIGILPLHIVKHRIRFSVSIQERRLAMPTVRRDVNTSSMLSLYNLVNAPLRTQGRNNQ